MHGVHKKHWVVRIMNFVAFRAFAPFCVWAHSERRSNYFMQKLHFQCNENNISFFIWIYCMFRRYSKWYWSLFTIGTANPSIDCSEWYLFFFRSLIHPKRNTSRILHKFSINENPKTKAPNRAKQWTWPMIVSASTWFVVLLLCIHFLYFVCIKQSERKHIYCAEI